MCVCACACARVHVCDIMCIYTCVYFLWSHLFVCVSGYATIAVFLLYIMFTVSAGSPLSQKGWPELPAGVLAPPGVSRRVANTEKTRLWSYSPGTSQGGREEGRELQLPGEEDMWGQCFSSFSLCQVQWVLLSLLYLH